MMADYEIIPLNPKDYHKCGNIWDMEHHAENAKLWYNQILSGNRLVFIYTEHGEFIAEGALLLDRGDPDYTLPGRRIYFSRVVVRPDRRNQGIGGIMIDFLIKTAKQMGYTEASIGVDKDNAAALHLYHKKGFTTVLFDGADEDGEYYKLLKYLDEQSNF